MSVVLIGLRLRVMEQEVQVASKATWLVTLPEIQNITVSLETDTLAIL